MEADESFEAVLDATATVEDLLEADEDVAHAEVGGVHRTLGDAVVDGDRVRSASDLVETGVWWRVFADGAADYRYVTVLDDEHLADFVERSVRAARQLGQERPARYDAGSMVRASHPGWARRALDEPAEAVADRLVAAVDEHLADLPIERLRVSYAGERLRTTLSTLTGSAVTCTLDRVGVETTLALPDAKLRDHLGGTTGGAVLDAVPDRLAALATEARAAADADAAPAPEGSASVVLAPRAAGELFHQLSRYLEADAVYLGSSDVEPGDRVGPEWLDVADVVRPGSWAAMAYDAEARPTQPVELVADGVVRSRLHSTASAAEEAATPAGSVVPAVGFEHPPRIHARHLDVEAGGTPLSALCGDADLLVERVGTPRLANEATRTKRASQMPPSVLYAHEIAEQTPSEFGDEAADQVVELPVAVGYALADGERAGRVTDAVLAVRLPDLRGLAGATPERATTTGVCDKHDSRLPYAVTAPGVRLPADVRPRSRTPHNK
jgi:TldD protein